MTYLILLLHMLALLMASLIQIAWHKMSALSVVFSRLSNNAFNKRTRSCQELLFCLFLCFVVVVVVVVGGGGGGGGGDVRACVRACKRACVRVFIPFTLMGLANINFNFYAKTTQLLTVQFVI